MSFLETLSLTNFRPYSALQLTLAPGLNMLVGGNGQGKTTILEAVYFLSLLRSFRTHQIRHLCRWKHRSFCVNGRLRTPDAAIQLAVMHGERRELRHNGHSLKRTSDFIGQFHCMAFVPEDIRLVQGPAGERRRFLDVFLCQLYPDYLSLLQEYNMALKSRNAILRRDTVDIRALASFDALLVRSGARLMTYRRQHCQQLQATLSTLITQSVSFTNDITLRYQSSFPWPSEISDVEGLLFDSLTESRDRDIQRHSTHIGPHRDDIQLLFNDRLLASFGSEGQCRLAALIVKMAAAEALIAFDAKPVVLLVDDVVGELDEHARDAFFSLLRKPHQVLFATTSRTTVPGLEAEAMFDVADGSVQRRC